MDLVLSEHTHNSFRELDEMNPERKLRYYFFILERKKAEMKSMKDKEKYKGREVDIMRGTNE